MFDLQNKFARVLDADTKEELKELYADDGTIIPLKLRKDHYVVSAEIAYKYNLNHDPRITLRCTGEAFIPGKGRRFCNAELYPYYKSSESGLHYYFRSYRNRDNGEGGMDAEDGLRKGHLKLCQFGFDPDGKTSIEWVYTYDISSDAMEKSYQECFLKIKKVKKSSGAGGNGESKKNENSENGSNNNNNPAGPVNIETELKKVSPKSAKEFWFASMNLCDKQKILTEKVMTPRNYLWFRQNPLSGYLTLMAGRSPHYKDYKEEITKQYTDLSALFGKSFEKIDEIKSSYKQRIDRCVAMKDFKRLNALKKERNALIEKCKNKITILEDPFIEDDPVIIVLIDKLSPDGDWKHLTRKKIDSKTLKDFVIGGFSWETVKDEFGNDQQIKVQHYADASYFAVMSKWQERPLMVDGKERKMVVGNIHALGRQIDYFLEDDLKTYSEKLRRTN